MYQYRHGGDVYDENGVLDGDVLDFSANINPLGMPDGVMASARRSLAHSNIYPDANCRSLTSRLAEFEGIDQGSIICANGASDILFRLVYALKPRKILITAPSFTDYERAGTATGAEIAYYPLKKENGFMIDEKITEAILAASPDIVFIGNPNNPTGALAERILMEKIATACQSVKARMLADECFMDFVGGGQMFSVKPLINKYQNIVLLKSFTKIFAIPGLRLGYAVCGDEEIIEALRFHGPDWAVSNVAIAAGEAALKKAKAFMESTAEYITEERMAMAAGLERMGLTVYPSRANFILFRDEANHDLYGALCKKGFRLRDCANFRGLGLGYFRAAVLTEEKNRRLIQAIAGVIKNE